jgi:hypothetical protein
MEWPLRMTIAAVNAHLFRKVVFAIVVRTEENTNETQREDIMVDGPCLKKSVSPSQRLVTILEFIRFERHIRGKQQPCSWAVIHFSGNL